MNIAFFGITWAACEHLVWLPLFLITICLLRYRFARIRKAIFLLAGDRQDALFRNISVYRSVLKIVLLSVGVLLLLLALLRPQWQKKEEIIAQEGRDIFIALDISRSMLATDVQPDRLVFAKKKIKQLVKQLDAERVGLILFSGSAFVQCPLTEDRAAFNLFLDQVDVETISSGSTALDQPLKEALRAFKRLPERKSKLVVLLSDGEDFSSNLTAFKRDIRDQGLHVFAVGVGTSEGAPIPLYDQNGNRVGHQKDEKGAIVISHLNETLLNELATDVGGAYIRMTKDDTDMQMLKKRLQFFEKEKLEDKTFDRLQEQYPYFLLVSFICFAFDWLL